MGRGPGEVLGLIDFCITNDGVVILHDISTNRFIMCSSAKLATGIFVTSDAESISLSNIPDVYTICSGEGSYYVSGYNDKERLFSLDTCLKYSNSFQYSPTNNHKLDHIINEAYCGNICYSDKHNSVILACRYADQIEVTNIYSGLSFIIKSRDGYQPDYQLVGGKLAHNDGEHSCYTDVRVRGDNIYALYNGSQISSYNSGQKSEIRVFSIKGNLLRRIVLNDAVKHFDFGDDDVIYASSEKGIFQYNI